MSLAQSKLLTITDPVDLELRLSKLDDESLLKVYEEVSEIWSGKPQEHFEKNNKRIWLTETAECKRGSLLRLLLGDCHSLDQAWYPTDNITDPLLGASICYLNTPSSTETKFSVKNADGSHYYLSEDQAKQLIESNETSPNFPLYIHAHFSNLLDGWSCVLTPIFCDSAHLQMFADTIPENDPWLLVTLNSQSKVIESSFEEPGLTLHKKPNLICFDSEPAEHTDQEAAVRADQLDQYASSIRSELALPAVHDFCKKIELFVQPSRNTMMTSIKTAYFLSLFTLEESNKQSTKAQHYDVLLREAKTNWEELFLNEKRHAINDLRLEVTSHPFRKMGLVTKGRREAIANKYVADQLMPRIHIFFEKLELSITKLELDFNKVDTSFKSSKGQMNESLLAGILFAAPSLGLIAGDLCIKIPEIKDSFSGKEKVTAPPDFSNESPEITNTPTIAEQSDDPWPFSRLLTPIKKELSILSDKAEIYFDEKFDQFSSSLSKHLEASRDLQAQTNEQLANLAGIVVASQASMFIGVLIAGIIQYKACMGLSKTENEIETVLTDSKAIWPQVELSLTSMLGTIQGHVTPASQHKAKSIVDRINQLSL